MALRTRCEELGVSFNGIKQLEALLEKDREVFEVLGRPEARAGLNLITLPTEVFDTRWHNEILRFFFEKTLLLSQGVFEGCSGQSAFYFFGAKGTLFFLFLFPDITFFLCSFHRNWQDHGPPSLHGRV